MKDNYALSIFMAVCINSFVGAMLGYITDSWLIGLGSWVVLSLSVLVVDIVGHFKSRN